MCTSDAPVLPEAAGKMTNLLSRVRRAVGSLSGPFLACVVPNTAFPELYLGEIAFDGYRSGKASKARRIRSMVSASLLVLAVWGVLTRDLAGVCEHTDI
jgi:hypothetical protein